MLARYQLRQAGTRAAGRGAAALLVACVLGLRPADPANAFSSPADAARMRAAPSSVLKTQINPRGPLSRLRLKRRIAPPKVVRPRLPPVGGKLHVVPKKTVRPRPTCGVPGRPRCKHDTKTGAVPPPPPPRPHCRGRRCRPHTPPLIVTPLPPAGGFDNDYLVSLPHVRERPPVARQTDPASPRQVLVILDAGQPANLENDLARQYRLRRLAGQPLTLLGARSQLYAIPDGRSVATVVSTLSGDGRVRLVQANFRYGRQGDARKTPPEVPQYALAKISVTPAHDLAQGRGVRVAVIDSEIDERHPDLSGCVAERFDATGGSQRARDGHGTAVAGIICARGALRGVAPMSEILAVRAFAPADKRLPAVSSTAVLLKAIEWSVVNGARVLNMSFAGPSDPAVKAMIEAAQARGAVVVAAAGNGGKTAPAAYPAAYPGVIAVTAVDATDNRYEHANRGDYIALAAPGVDILAPVEGGRHAFLSGTSFAAPHVSGILALLLERSATLDPQAALGVLARHAVDLGPTGRDEDFGFGRADALATLQDVAVAGAAGGR